MYSSGSESSPETDNEQTQDSAQSAAFSSEKLTNLQLTADGAGSDDEGQYSVETEGGALPLPAWMDASSQDSSVADARVQSIKDIIRVRDCPFVLLVILVFYVLPI